jgi:hypothetical protein
MSWSLRFAESRANNEKDNSDQQQRRHPDEMESILELPENQHRQEHQHGKLHVETELPSHFIPNFVHTVRQRHPAKLLPQVPFHSNRIRTVVDEVGDNQPVGQALKLRISMFRWEKGLNNPRLPKPEAQATDDSRAMPASSFACAL